MAVKKTKDKNKKIKEQVEEFLESKTIEAQITKIVLAVIFLSGIIFIAITAPNIFSAFGRFPATKRLSKKEFDGALYTLKRRGFIKIIKDKKGNTTVSITSKGKIRVKTFCLESLSIPKQRVWDGKWRVVIFDIPAKAGGGKARGAFRQTLKDLGFYQVQQSVWAYPYPCEDEVLFVANFFNVEQYLEIFLASNFLYEKEMKARFKL